MSWGICRSMTILLFPFLVLIGADATPPPADPGVAPAVTAQIALAMPTARVTPAAPRRLLVMTKTQGFRHASIGAGCEALRQMSAATHAFDVTFSADLADLSSEHLAAFDGLLLLNTTQLKPDAGQKQALLDFVRVKGKGLIGIHAALDNFPGWPEGQQLMGGVFAGHPWGAGDTSAVKIDDPANPVVAAFGGQGFWITDEIYQVSGAYSRTDLHVLLSLDMSHEENTRPAKAIVRTDHDHAIAWIAQRDAGRLFYTCLGHNPGLYAMPKVLQHYLDGIQFALGDLTASSMPSATLPPMLLPVLAPAPPASVHPAKASK